MHENQLKTLSASSFGSLNLLRSLQFNDNPIEAIDAEIFNKAKSLKIVRFSKNFCIDEIIEIEAIRKDQIVQNDEKFSKFNECFENFMKLRRDGQKGEEKHGLKIEL